MNETEIKEITNVRQIPGELNRRWFSSDKYDLFVWTSDDQRIVGFELCYDKLGKERAIRWKTSVGFQHMSVDDGEQDLGKLKKTPILVADGLFNAKKIISEFSKASHSLPDEIAEFVLNTLQQYPKGFAEMPSTLLEGSDVDHHDT